MPKRKPNNNKYDITPQVARQRALEAWRTKHLRYKYGHPTNPAAIHFAEVPEDPTSRSMHIGSPEELFSPLEDMPRTITFEGLEQPPKTLEDSARRTLASAEKMSEGNPGLSTKETAAQRKVTGRKALQAVAVAKEAHRIAETKSDPNELLAYMEAQGFKPSHVDPRSGKLEFTAARPGASADKITLRPANATGSLQSVTRSVTDVLDDRKGSRLSDPAPVGAHETLLTEDERRVTPLGRPTTVERMITDQTLALHLDMVPDRMDPNAYTTEQLISHASTLATADSRELAAAAHQYSQGKKAALHEYVRKDSPGLDKDQVSKQAETLFNLTTGQAQEAVGLSSARELKPAEVTRVLGHFGAAQAQAARAQTEAELNGIEIARQKKLALTEVQPGEKEEVAAKLDKAKSRLEEAKREADNNFRDIAQVDPQGKPLPAQGPSEAGGKPPARGGRILGNKEATDKLIRRERASRAKYITAGEEVQQHEERLFQISRAEQMSPEELAQHKEGINAEHDAEIDRVKQELVTNIDTLRAKHTARNTTTLLEQGALHGTNPDYSNELPRGSTVEEVYNGVEKYYDPQSGQIVSLENASLNPHNHKGLKGWRATHEFNKEQRNRLHSAVNEGNYYRGYQLFNTSGDRSVSQVRPEKAEVGIRSNKIYASHSGHFRLVDPDAAETSQTTIKVKMVGDSKLGQVKPTADPSKTHSVPLTYSTYLDDEGNPLKDKNGNPLREGNQVYPSNSGVLKTTDPETGKVTEYEHTMESGFKPLPKAHSKAGETSIPGAGKGVEVTREHAVPEFTIGPQEQTLEKFLRSQGFSGVTVTKLRSTTARGASGETVPVQEYKIETSKGQHLNPNELASLQHVLTHNSNGLSLPLGDKNFKVKGPAFKEDVQISRHNVSKDPGVQVRDLGQTKLALDTNFANGAIQTQLGQRILPSDSDTTEDRAKLENLQQKHKATQRDLDELSDVDENFSVDAAINNRASNLIANFRSADKELTELRTGNTARKLGLDAAEQDMLDSKLQAQRDQSAADFQSILAATRTDKAEDFKAAALSKDELTKQIASTQKEIQRKEGLKGKEGELAPGQANKIRIKGPKGHQIFADLGNPRSSAVGWGKSWRPGEKELHDVVLAHSRASERARVLEATRTHNDAAAAGLERIDPTIGNHKMDKIIRERDPLVTDAELPERRSKLKEEAALITTAGGAATYYQAKDKTGKRLIGQGYTKFYDKFEPQLSKIGAVRPSELDVLRDSHQFGYHLATARERIKHPLHGDLSKPSVGWDFHGVNFPSDTSTRAHQIWTTDSRPLPKSWKYRQSWNLPTTEKFGELPGSEIRGGDRLIQRDMDELARTVGVREQVQDFLSMSEHQIRGLQPHQRVYRRAFLRGNIATVTDEYAAAKARVFAHPDLANVGTGSDLREHFTNPGAEAGVLKKFAGVEAQADLKKTAQKLVAHGDSINVSELASHLSSEPVEVLPNNTGKAILGIAAAVGGAGYLAYKRQDTIQGVGKTVRPHIPEHLNIPKIQKERTREYKIPDNGLTDLLDVAGESVPVAWRVSKTSKKIRLKNFSGPNGEKFQPGPTVGKIELKAPVKNDGSWGNSLYYKQHTGGRYAPQDKNLYVRGKRIPIDIDVGKKERWNQHGGPKGKKLSTANPNKLSIQEREKLAVIGQSDPDMRRFYADDPKMQELWSDPIQMDRLTNRYATIDRTDEQTRKYEAVQAAELRAQVARNRSVGADVGQTRPLSLEEHQENTSRASRSERRVKGKAAMYLRDS